MISARELIRRMYRRIRFAEGKTTAVDFYLYEDEQGGSMDTASYLEQDREFFDE